MGYKAIIRRYSPLLGSYIHKFIMFLDIIIQSTIGTLNLLYIMKGRKTHKAHG